MAVVKFTRKEFERHIKISKETEEKISSMGTPVEEVTKDEIHIEVFPNRPDLLSMQGFIRAFKSYTGKEKGLKKYKINKPEKNYKVIIDKSVNQVRPYTVCAIVKNLKFDDEKIKEIVNFQEKVHDTLGRKRKAIAIGMYPLEKIKLPIRYEARNPKDIKFIPLEAKREMTGTQILQRHPTGRDYAHLLEDKKKYPIFIDANNKILSMPPIINSQETGKVSNATKEIFVECSGSNLEILKKTLNILVTTLADMGGKIYSITIEKSGKHITPDLTPEKIRISLENVNKLLGLKLKESDLEKLLQKMGHDYKNKTVLVPAWRTDILHEVDIIEDIAIAYGYEKIAPEIPNIATVGKESKESKLKTKISEILIGLQLLEISSYHLIKPDESKKMKIKNQLILEDSKTDYKILRSDLLTSTLRILSENKDNEYPQNSFEIGKVFQANNATETGINEQHNLIISLAPGNFTEAKRILDYLTKILNIEYKLEQTSVSNFIEGRTGKVTMNNKDIGHVGEIHPNTLRSWNLKMPMSVIEINLEEVFKLI